MSYYQGDFYQGDPGFFGSLGRIFKGVAKSAVGFIPGVGPVASKVISHLPGVAPGRSLPKLGPVIAAGRAAIIKHPVLSAAGAAGVIGAAGVGVGHALAGSPAHALRGMHISKKTGQMVRNRRMNPCNGRALRRAIRRAHAFERLAKRVIGFSSPRKPKGHMYFKRRKKK